MRKIRYFITEESDTITGEFEVADTATEDEISDMLTAEVAVKVHGNKWSAEWEFVD